MCDKTERPILTINDMPIPFCESMVYLYYFWISIGFENEDPIVQDVIYSAIENRKRALSLSKTKQRLINEISMKALPADIGARIETQNTDVMKYGVRVPISKEQITGE